MIAAMALPTVAGVTRPLHAATLSWEAPAGCPDRDAIRWRVEEALGTKLDAAADLSFVASVKQNGATRWVVTLEVGPMPTDAPSAGIPRREASESATPDIQKRTLEAASCDELAQATSVAIALALGADIAATAAREDNRTPAPSETVSAELAKPRAQAATRAKSAAATKKQAVTSQRHWFSAELGAVLDRGALPDWAPGIEGAVSLGVGAFSVQAGGLVLPRESTRVSGDAGGAFALYTATLGACGATERGTARLQLCVGAEVGRLTGEGINVANRQLGASTWCAPRGDLGVSIPLGDPSLRLLGYGGLVVPLIRSRRHSARTAPMRLDGGWEPLPMLSVYATRMGVRWPRRPQICSWI